MEGILYLQFPTRMSNQQQQAQPIYLFVSKDCNNCVTLVNEIRKKPDVAKNIQAVPVETAPRLPPNLTHVPTILHEGKMYVGKDCFEWLRKQGELDAAPPMSSKGGTFDNSNYSFIGSDNSGSTLEGGGLGDYYSFIGQPNGSEGIKQVDEDPQRRQQQGSNNKQGLTGDFEKMQKMRDNETGNLQKAQQRTF